LDDLRFGERPGSFNASRKRNRSGMLEKSSSIDSAPTAESISCRSAGLLGRLTHQAEASLDFSAMNFS